MGVTIDQVIEGKYRITRLIGQGGMGAVYEGVNERIDRRVAIKVLLPTEDKTTAARFEQEARAAGRIANDHILEVLDVGALPDGSQYMVTEFLDGEPLASRIERFGRLDAATLTPMVIQLLKGLEAAHRAGIVHRDLKPDNVFLLREKAGQADFVKIIDFGISKFNQLSGDDFSMTKTGTMMGTPYYLSPEQARGQGGVDHRVDIYAVGVILFEAASGRVPFQAESFNDLLFKIVLEEAPLLEELVPDLDPSFVALVKKGMARKVDDRFASATEFREAVEAWASEKGIPTSSLAQGRAPLSSTSGGARRHNSSAPPAFAATSPRTAAHPTPGAFGSTGAAPSAEEPLWAQRKIQIAAGVGALALIGAIVALVGSSDPSDSTPAAAAAPPKAVESEIVPTVDPAFVQAEPPKVAPATAEPTKLEPAKAEPAPTQSPTTATKPATATQSDAKKPAAPAPAQAPAAATAPAKTPKKKYYYGY